MLKNDHILPINIKLILPTNIKLIKLVLLICKIKNYKKRPRRRYNDLLAPKFRKYQILYLYFFNIFINIIKKSQKNNNINCVKPYWNFSNNKKPNQIQASSVHTLPKKRPFTYLLPVSESTIMSGISCLSSSLDIFTEFHL